MCAWAHFREVTSWGCVSPPDVLYNDVSLAVASGDETNIFVAETSLSGVTHLHPRINGNASLPPAGRSSVYTGCIVLKGAKLMCLGGKMFERMVRIDISEPPTTSREKNGAVNEHGISFSSPFPAVLRSR